MKIFLYCSVAVAVMTTRVSFAESDSLKRGRYLSTVAGCNDCHTSGFAPSGGKIPEKDWLLGDAIGFKGGWGTSYPINLRKFVSGMEKSAWIAFARASNARPPMPSYILHLMTDEDLGALYDFMKFLGDGGVAAPAALPPGEMPKGPYFDFEPKNLPPAAGK